MDITPGDLDKKKVDQILSGPSDLGADPKTGEKVHTRKKVKIHFKMAKELFNKLNNEK